MKIRTCIVALAASAGVCFGQAADAEAFEKMIAHYEQLQGCTVSIGIEMKTDDPMMAAMMSMMNKSTPGYAVKPNLFAFWQDADPDAPAGPMGMDMPNPVLYSDGEQILSAVESMSIYSEHEAPADFAVLLDDPDAGLAQGWDMIPGANFLFALMSPDPRETLIDQISEVEYAGLVGEGEDSYHAFTTVDDDGTPLEMRVAAMGEPWLLGFKPDLTDTGAPEGLEVMLTFKEWHAITATPAEGKITPDAKWEKVDDIGEALFGEMGMGMGQQEMDDEGREGRMAEKEDAPHSIGVGDTAPAFTLPRLGSEDSFTLADHKGKVVVLDFWATWCPPCVKGLPVVSSVTASYADQGVVFAAVNLQEDAEHVAEFMDKKDWEFDVALDAKGEAAGLYGVSSIPHSVIIDKKGVIRFVHIGFGGAKEYEKQMKKELEELIAE